MPPEEDGSAMYHKILRKEDRVVKKLKRKDCGKKEDIGNTSSILLYMSFVFPVKHNNILFITLLCFDRKNETHI
jgi:hypothetical protein